MFPVLFKIGPFSVYSYGVMIALAAIICSYLLSRDAQKHQISSELIYDFIFWVLAWGILSARVFYVVLMWDYFKTNLLETIMIMHGGLAWQGGLIGGVLSGLWFIHQRKLDLRLFIDLAAPYIALGQAIGRIGCFLNGCCFGKPVAWGIYFPVHHDHLHPTQLYETAGLFLAFVILKFAQQQKHQPGMIFVLYLWLAAIERFIVEFYRADHEVLMLGLSLFQYISLGFFIVGLFLLLRFKKT